MREPGLVVITGAPGSGRSTLLRRLQESFRGTVYAGGGLAMLRGVAALPLARALRVRLPVHDPALLSEAVRSRVRHGLLLIDDLQWADPLTVAALPAIAAHCRVAVTLRTPHRLPGDAEQTLRAAATVWLAAPPLTAPIAEAMIRQIAPAASPAAVADIVRRAGGVPLAVTALARRAATRRDAPAPDSDAEGSGLAYAVATALADLGRPARTAMAALGLLGRPAPAAMLGEGAAELAAAGLIEITSPAAGPVAGASATTSLAIPIATPVSPFVAEIAAGLLDPAERAALHRRLAGVVPPREAARHLAAAGAAQEAYTVAVEAAAGTPSSGDRAELLLLACDLPGVTASAEVRLAAAKAALVAGRPQACLRVLGDEKNPRPVDAASDPAAAVLRGEALLQTGAAPAARVAVEHVPDDAAPDIVGGRDRLRLLGVLGTDPAAAGVEEAQIRARHGDEPAHLGLRAALAAVRAANRAPGWEYGLATAAAAAGTGGDPLAARWSAWLLVETLTADGRLADAASAAATAGAACAADLAYSWQTRFLAAQLWCTALRGADLDQVTSRAGDLTDRTLPAIARGYAAAAVSLTEADGGLLASARGRLTEAGHGPAAPVVDWVAREAAWLDGQPEVALSAGSATSAGPLLDGLRQITANWAAHDTGGSPAAAGPPGLPVVAATVSAWATRSAEGFTAAAGQWHDVARREEVRSLLAAGLFDDQPDRAVPALLQAEKLAEEAGLVVLLGRARRALRRHAVRRDTRGRRAGDELTDRERDVLRLVAKGEPTRRIAGQLGISRETVETHIRAGMRKLGARTRTEAAALAMEALSLEGDT
ncbi:helix-turn-helix transcriptional regulator [Virgisporangium aurantiacum]|uniref:helix-turn-helix transcriptional regulator n=1 Tax=Virgisporangium aurantiacum TaxID=175570 RepID=UPI001EF1D0A6|nr:LuxR C-terminal-related transcriptional regulator [Virgisporangium aurantiacum]